MATQRFIFNYNPDTRINLRRRNQQASNSVASVVQVNRWYTNIFEYVRVHDTTAEIALSVSKSAEAYFALLEPLWVAALNVAIAAPAAIIPVPNPPRPPGHLDLGQEAYDQMNAVYVDALNTWMQTPAAIALVGFQPTAAASPNFVGLANPIDATMDERDFQDLHWQLLEAMAHSGFTGVGDFEQDIIYTLHNLPSEEIMLTIRAGTIISQCLPAGVTPFNIGAAHADQIARTAKELDIMFDWGTKHGVPKLYNHLGFATWSYIKDKSLLSEEARAVMNEVTSIAIRDSASAEVNDPRLPKLGMDENRKSAAQTTLAYNQIRSKHGYSASSTTKEALNRFRFGRFGEED